MSQKINLQSFKDFVASSYFGSFLLLICLIASLVIANTNLLEPFHHFLATQVGFTTGSVDLNFSIEQWINDGLMAIFFLLVGLEIKRELVEGELSSLQKASMPILSAFGGAIVPAAIYFAFNNGQETINGWGIPMATDIAFALAVISLLGKSVPPSLKIFLAALAIVDDLIAILVIAIFYSTELHFIYLGYAAALLGLLILFNKLGIKAIWMYLIPGCFIWYFVHHSGIHATIAGVAVAFTLPTNATDTPSPLERLEHLLTKPVNYFIIPVFALVNTMITYQTGMVEGLTSSLGLGIILGLVFGKVIGITLTSWLAIKLKIGAMPELAKWKHLIGVGFLGGIGFTMSIFVSLLSFEDPAHINEAKFSILLASILSGLIGFLLLKSTTEKGKIY